MQTRLNESVYGTMALDGGIIAQDHHYSNKGNKVFISSPLSLCSHICSELFTSLFTQLRTKLRGIMSQHGSKKSWALFSVAKDKVSSAAAQKHVGPQDISFFDCVYCEGFMAQPVCLPCGHSMCKMCIDKVANLGSAACPKCKEPIASCLSGRTPTLMMRDILKKRFPEWVESCQFREVGNTFANEGDFPIAIEWYSKAISTGESNPCD